MNKKDTGSYYTPIRLSNFLVDYCLSHIKIDKLKVLEPSVGNGNFVESLSKNNRIDEYKEISLTIIEREESELKKAISRKKSELKIDSHNIDYLEYHIKSKRKFDLVIGNPPYIKSNLLSDKQKRLSKEIHLDNGLKDKKINNIWTAFLIGANQKLKNSGLFAFILPLELLQVKFSEEIRNFLKSKFDRIEVFMFDELQFQECKGQDTIIIIGFKQHKEKGTFYTTIKNIKDLEDRNFTLSKNISVSESSKKWTHHFLLPEEHTFLEKVKSNLKLINQYVDNKAGIVTAANDYFIINNERMEKYGLQDYCKPIVQKGFFVNGSVTFENEDFNNLIYSNKPSFLLDLNQLNDGHIPDNVQKYLSIGIQQKLQDRFKCKQRKYWYQIPNIAKQSPAFFFKRAHDYPKFLLNNANSYVTDSAYMIQPKSGVNIENVVFSFYNSLTLAYTELEGRFYGGGVLELTPNEFRSLPLPYSKIKNFSEYKTKFKSKIDIEHIINEYNYYILNSSLGLNLEEISKIESIRTKLVRRRQKK